MDKIELIIQDIEKVCDDEMLDWWEVVDSYRFDEIINYNPALANLTTHEIELLNKWYQALQDTICAIKDIHEVRV